MYPLTNIDSRVTGATVSETGAKRMTAVELAAEEEAEVLAFLGERPAHTFGMAGFIRDNGLVSPHNRGTFYGCRNAEGRLEGVALIGHFALFETRGEEAIQAFARVAKEHPSINMMLGQQEAIERFWRYYEKGGQAPRLFCRELLFELRWPVEVQAAVPGLRLATSEDLDLVVPSHARTVAEESGINPLDVDPIGFRQRCERRIEQGHTWVLVEDGKLLFKAEIVADTPAVIYLEGVEVNPEERGKGIGLRCTSQLSRTLLQRTSAICLLVNQRNSAALAFYRRAGFKLTGCYDTIFLIESTSA